MPACDREKVLERFEAAWRQGTPPALGAFLPPAQPGSAPGEDASCRALFHELVKIDLEYRWRGPPQRDAGPLPARPRLDDYVRLLPGFGAVQDLPIDLIGEEYRVRQRWGDRPTHGEYTSRFAKSGPALDRELTRIDAELDKEQPTQILRRGAVSPVARPAATLRCPHCRSTIDVPGDHPPRDLACPACGGAFQVETLPAPADQQARPPFPRLGRYELGALLGAGAFGSVWRARDTELNRDVAVKLPRAGRAMSPADEERFLREARAAARLHHPGIVAVHDVGRFQDTIYLVSELVHGVSLSDLLKQRRVSFREAAELIAAVADALDFAHRNGVVHRDVKPSNIMLEASNGGVVSGEWFVVSDNKSVHSPLTTHHSPLTTHHSPKLMDFGLALRDASEVTMTLDGQVLGTPAYISPEQLRNPHAVDGRSDVYSLGVILYELLTGELPFRGMTRMLLDQVMHEAPPPPRRLNDRIPQDLETICLKCLAKEPGGRYPTAAGLAADLRRWLGGLPIIARPQSPIQRLGRWLQRHPLPAITFGLALAALAPLVGMPVSAVIVTLMVVTLGSALFALQCRKAADELAVAVEAAHEDQQKTASALQCALENLVQAKADRDRAVSIESQASRRFNLLHGLARTWIFDLPAQLSKWIGQAPARATMISAALTYLDGLAKEAGDDAALLRETAVAYGRIGDLQMESPGSKAGDPAAGLASYRKGLDLFTALARRHPDNVQAQRDFAAAAAKVRELEGNVRGAG